jgi:hypothetical protein
MSMAVVFEFLKKLLPMNKIGAFILGLIGAALALFIGTNNADMKAAYCAAEVVALPKVEAPAVVPAPIKEEK